MNWHYKHQLPPGGNDFFLGGWKQNYFFRSSIKVESGCLHQCLVNANHFWVWDHFWLIHILLQCFLLCLYVFWKNMCQPLPLHSLPLGVENAFPGPTARLRFNERNCWWQVVQLLNGRKTWATVAFNQILYCETWTSLAKVFFNALYSDSGECVEFIK